MMADPPKGEKEARHLRFRPLSELVESEDEEAVVEAPVQHNIYAWNACLFAINPAPPRADDDDDEPRPRTGTRRDYAGRAVPAEEQQLSPLGPYTGMGVVSAQHVSSLSAEAQFRALRERWAAADQANLRNHRLREPYDRGSQGLSTSHQAQQPEHQYATGSTHAACNVQAAKRRRFE